MAPATDPSKHLMPWSGQARLHRAMSADYRQNGLDHLKGDAGRTSAVYDNDAKICAYLRRYGVTPRAPGVEPASPQHARAYHLAEFRAEGAGTPYLNVGHHLVPCEAVTEAPGGAFTREERELLELTTYDINHGHNIAFLPGFSRGAEVQSMARARGVDVESLPEEKKQQGLFRTLRETYRHCNVHKLPCHVDMHAEYIRKVVSDLRGTARILAAQRTRPCEEWDPPSTIVEEIRRVEDDYWGYVVRYGESLQRGGNVDRLVRIPVQRRRALGRS